MNRTQLQIDEDTRRALRERAFREHKSMSAVARELLRDGLGLGKRAARARRKRFAFVGSGASGRGDISVRHDDALVEDLR